MDAKLLKLIATFFVAALSLGFTSCGGDDDDDNVKSRENNKLDVAVTGNISEVGINYAVISGIVNADKISATYSNMEFGVEVSINSDFNDSRRVAAGSLVSRDFSVEVTGLLQSTKYYYRTYVNIPSLTFVYYGSAKTFTTADSGSGSVSICSNSNHPHAIDMGAAGIWACCNVGANNPEDYGSYFAWGETSPKSDYSWETYKWGKKYDELTKYCNNSYLGKNGFTDTLTELVSDDDCATKNWGSNWQMPSSIQMEKLNNYCRSEWTHINGVAGRLFYASNGNRIFLPAAGYRYGYVVNSSHGDYWSSSLDTSYPVSVHRLVFNLDDVALDYFYGIDRCSGHTVRPVRR